MCMRPMLMLPSHFIVFLFFLLCIFFVTVENVPYITFDNPHVYKQLCTCVYTHLDKYNLCLIVISCLHSNRLIEFMYYNVLMLYTVTLCITPHSLYKD